MIDVEVARTFLKVAETGSFQVAAENLNITQSTVSARIKTLEERLGHKVFERLRAGALLNAHGRRFQRYAWAIVSAWDEGRRIVAQDQDPIQRLRIGAEQTLWTGLLGRWLSALHDELPRAEISARAGESDSLARDLLRNELDIAVTSRSPSEESLEVDHLADEEVILVTSDPAGSFKDRYLNVRWDAEGTPLQSPKSRTSIALGAASVEYLIASHSAGYVPRRLADPYLAAGHLFAARAPAFTTPIFALHRRGETSETLTKGLLALRQTISLVSTPKLKDLADAFRLRADR